MDSDSTSVDIQDHETWEQRRARLRALESVNGTQLQAESKYRVSLKLWPAVEQGNVDKFIEAIENCSAGEGVPLSDIIKIEGPSGNSLLHAAAGIEEGDILQALLEVIRDKSLTAKVNCRGDTALHIAARAGRIRAAELLLSCRGIVDTANDIGNTALHEAVKNSNRELTRLLLSQGSNLVYKENKEGKCPLYLAVEMEDSTNLKLLMEAVDGHEILPSQIEGMSPVHGAVLYKRIEMLKEMSKRKELFDLRDDKGGTPLHLAAYLNYIDGVEFLVNNFASSAFEGDKEGYLPIHVACKMDRRIIVKKLLHLWPNPDELLNLKDGQNILHVAAKCGSTSVIRFILDNPKLERLINAKDKEGNTPLHVAASQLKFPAILSLVAEEVVDIEVVNNRHLTALDIADEQLAKIWTLEAVKAPRSIYRASRGPEGRDPWPTAIDPVRDTKPTHLDRLRDKANAHMVVAALVATMTFAAGFSVPGGYKNSEPDVGIAALLNKPMYDVFVICNTIAMYSSIIAVVLLPQTQLIEFQVPNIFLKRAKQSLDLAIATMSVAFMAGVYVTVSKRTWVAVVFLIIGITALEHTQIRARDNSLISDPNSVSPKVETEKLFELSSEGFAPLAPISNPSATNTATKPYVSSSFIAPFSQPSWFTPSAVKMAFHFSTVTSGGPSSITTWSVSIPMSEAA
ncbi:protein ACCELERATED CELL DEATH 6-like [Rhodamnia argentea]|uniref:Protein ACCELERATED CELL DEATH 6-like n=1 Tax=Rhodamnia argentea TaxID=178133 RepID=A0ABM3HBM6_9MYRT|nr:protein ACCELERATED CELL DEATH 6-like [Rhodamnia argentea]